VDAPDVLVNRSVHIPMCKQGLRVADQGSGFNDFGRAPAFGAAPVRAGQLNLEEAFVDV
jgi:hypothetical protein